MRDLKKNKTRQTCVSMCLHVYGGAPRTIDMSRKLLSGFLSLQKPNICEHKALRQVLIFVVLVLFFNGWSSHSVALETKLHFSLCSVFELRHL